MELHGSVPGDDRDVHLHDRLHDDERRGHVDRRYVNHWRLRVDDDYGEDERDSAALSCRVGAEPYADA